MGLYLVLHNIRSIYNVGAILRTAEGFGITRVVYSGYTPVYQDTRLLPHLRGKLDRQITKSALGAEKLVPQEATDNITEWLKQQKADGKTILGLENNLDPDEEKRKIILKPDEAELRDTKEVILILGEEVHGIPSELRKLCDYFLEIPMHGQKESFNVSVAAGIAMWALTTSRG